FNFADICVTLGVIIMLFAILFLEKEEKTAKKSKKAGRVPFARTAAALPEAGVLPDAGILPDAETLSEADAAAPLNDEDHGHANA
ncbi:MAG: hypothetical protein J5722_00510, partial [Oscillospiraceae bacterium]|nr:hypothetical protein [Oscillospiraceae bacterium]